MGKFLKNILSRILILTLIWMLASRAIPKRFYLGAEYLRWETVFDALKPENQSKLPNNLILGDSGPEMGLDAKQLRAVNFAIGGTSFPEGYYILNQLNEHRIDTLFLSYGQFHFQSMDCFYNRTDFYGMLSPEFIDEVVRMAEAEKDSSYLRKNWPWLDQLESTFYLDALVKEFRYVHSLYEIQNYRWYFREGEALKDSMLANQYSYLFPFKACTRDSVSMARKLEETEGGFRLSPINAYYFGRILETCRKRDIQVVWLNMPLNGRTQQASPKYFQDFENTLNKLLPEGTPVIPYKTMDNCSFVDFSHLHASAAREHTGWIRQYLRDSLISKSEETTQTP